jgi:D-sedoheptulose 7-phosphate isomerase
MDLDIERYLDRAAANFLALKALAPDIERVAEVLARAVLAGDKVMFCGNGGSAADAQHLAAELMGRFLKERDPLPALALTVDTSALTAIGNDYGFRDVFSRQLRGIGRRGDVLVALSTSGNSENVLAAVAAAKVMGITSIGLTGQAGGQLRSACDICICVPSGETNHIQEMHIAVGHFVCGYVEDKVLAVQASGRRAG